MCVNARCKWALCCLSTSSVQLKWGIQVLQCSKESMFKVCGVFVWVYSFVYRLVSTFAISVHFSSFCLRNATISSSVSCAFDLDSEETKSSVFSVWWWHTHTLAFLAFFSLYFTVKLLKLNVQPVQFNLPSFISRGGSPQWFELGDVSERTKDVKKPNILTHSSPPDFL